MSRRLLWWLATLAAVAGGIVFELRAVAAHGPVLCLFRRAFELPCPGCGMTRALGHLLSGELASAVAIHPLAPLLAAEAAVGWALLGLAAHGRVGLPERPWIERSLAITGCLLLAVWMGRLAVGDLSAVRP